MMKKFSNIILVFLILCSAKLYSQSINVPMKHWLYDFLDRLETKQIFNSLSTKSYPLLRTDVAKILAHVDSCKYLLNKNEIALLEQLKGEFNEELIKFSIEANPRFFERHLLTWRENEHYARIDFDFAQVFDVKRGEQYDTPERTSQTTMGGIIRGQIGRHFNFYIHAQNTLNRGTDITQENFDPQYGAPITISGENVYSDESWAYFTWNQSWFHLEYGRDQLKWGPGIRGSLMLSKENPLFEMLKFNFKFNRFQFMSFHGKLHSSVNTKYIAGHRLELKVFSWLYLGGSEVVIYGNRDIEPAYLNPLMPYHVAEHHLGDKDNNTMSFDMTIYPYRNHKLYVELFLDDFTTAENPLTYYGNKFAFLLGHRWVSPFGLANADLKWEYARIEPYVYTHFKEINTYQNYDQSIGYWLGPNSDDLFIEFDYILSKDLKFAITTERIRRGQGNINTPHNMIDGIKKEFLSGIVETKWSYGLCVTDQLFKDVFLSLNYFHLKTNNLNKIKEQKSNDNHISFELFFNW